MTALERFSFYLAGVERLLRWKSIARGASLLALLLLAVTVAGSAYAARQAFSESALLAARLALVLAAGCGLTLAVIVPVLRITKRRAARLAEAEVPALEERAATLTGPGAGSPLAELVAEEALACTAAVPPRSLVGLTGLALFAAAAAVMTAILFWLTSAAPGALGYGARLLWTGAPPAGRGLLFQLQVQPGNGKVRRGGDQAIQAVVTGLETGALRLRVRSRSGAQWETLPMTPSPAGRGFGFLLAGLTEDVDYQVDAGRLVSPVYRLTVVDLPAVERIRVRYNYPAYLGLPAQVEDPGGDIRAVEGSRAEIEVQTNLPLPHGVLVLDDGSRLPLERRGARLSRAAMDVVRDGAYYVASLEGGSLVRLSEDYFVEAQRERAPEVRISRPGRDAKVSPIEEVAVEVEASDDYGLQDFELRYSVNGGPERTLRLPFRKGGRQAQHRTVLALEDFRLQPGDVVGLSAVARDARTSSHTDIYFLEAQPFEREYQQSQTMGGMGGGEGGQQDDIAQRQKEMIAATWNQIKTPKTPAQAQEDGAFLAGVQRKLAAQAKSLSARMRARQLASASEEVQKFSQEMDDAAKAMEAAAGRLTGRQWRDALGPEQQGLQHLLRAQSTFRQIQVAFGQRGGGGGGGGGQMRDLESLFELELDTEKNQYETAQTGSSAGERERQIDEALKKLEELARRQQQASEQQQRREQTFEQRWSQEMLRREAEQLRRQMEALQRGSERQPSSSPARSSGQMPGGATPRGGSQSASPGESAASARLRRAGQQLEAAIEEMRQAQRAQAGQAAEMARRAAGRMAQALSELSSLRRQQAGDRLEDLARSAAALAARQRNYEEQVRKLFPQPPGETLQPPRAGAEPGQIERLSNEKEAMQREYGRLEQAMRDAARALDSSRKSAASRVRGALGEAQQSELGLRLRLGAEWMRRGLGPYLAPRERAVTEALDRLRDHLEEARELAGRESGSRSEAAGRALSRVESLRARLQDQLGASGGSRRPQQGDQAGNQPSQPGRSAQEARSGAPGQGGAVGGRRAGQPGGADFRRGDYGALNDGTLQPGWQRGAAGGDLQNSWLDTLRQLRQLRLEGGVSDETQAELERLLGEMQHMDPARAGGALLAGRIENELLPQLEQLELRLRQEAAGSSGQPRMAGPRKAPPGYEEAVADYFRRLSKGK